MYQYFLELYRSINSRNEGHRLFVEVNAKESTNQMNTWLDCNGKIGLSLKLYLNLNFKDSESLPLQGFIGFKLFSLVLTRTVEINR